MNKLQILEAIFGTGCFTPYVRCYNGKEYYSAKSKLTNFNDWSCNSVEVFAREALKYGARMGVDFDRKEFTLTFNQ